MEVTGTVAFITGGVSGIGLSVATDLLRNGAKNVTLVDVNEKAAGEVVPQLNEEFGSDKAVFIKADVGNTKELEDAVQKTLDRFKYIDIFFNNAGILNEVNWEKTLDVNLKAVIAGTHLGYKLMGKHNGGKGGVIINTSSVTALRPFGGIPVYTTTKFGILGLGRAFGKDFHYERSGVRVITLCPGLTMTNIVQNVVISDDVMGKVQQEDTDSLIPQPAEIIGKHVVNILKNAKHGTQWFIENDKTYLLKFPAIEEIEKTEYKF